jgi:YHS domain-containing protein
MTMKMIRNLTVALVAISILGGPLTALAGDEKTDAKPKPYTLKTCPVSGEKLGEMGKAFVFVHEGREIKLCCKDCLKDFKKDPAKYIKKIEEAEAKEKAKS